MKLSPPSAVVSLSFAILGLLGACATGSSPRDFMGPALDRMESSTSAAQQHEPRYERITSSQELADLIVGDLRSGDGLDTVSRGLSAFLANARYRGKVTAANAVFKDAKVVRLLESSGGRPLQTQATQITGVLQAEAEEELRTLDTALKASDFEALRSALASPDGMLSESVVTIDRSLLLKRKTYLLALQLHDLGSAPHGERDAALDATIQTLEETAVWSSLSGDTDGRIALSVMAASALDERGRTHEAMEHWLRIADSSGFGNLHPELQKDVIQRIASYRARLKEAVELEVSDAHGAEIQQLNDRFEGVISGLRAEQQAEITRLTESHQVALSDSKDDVRSWRDQATALTAAAAERLGGMESNLRSFASTTGLSSLDASDAWTVARFALKVYSGPRRGVFRVVNALL